MLDSIFPFVFITSRFFVLRPIHLNRLITKKLRIKFGKYYKVGYPYWTGIDLEIKSGRFSTFYVHQYLKLYKVKIQLSKPRSAPRKKIKKFKVKVEKINITSIPR